MGTIIGLVALLVTLAAVVVGGGHVAYLAMLNSAANKRAGGRPAADFAKKRYPIAGVGLGVGLLALLISTGGVGADVVAILLGAGGGIGSLKALQTSQHRFRNGEY